MVEWKKLGDLGTFIRGTGIQKSDFVDEGYPCIHYGQIHTKYGISTEKTISFISEELYKKSKKAVKGDVVLATTSEDAEGVAKPVAWLGDNDVAISGDAFIFHHNQNGKYLAHVFASQRFNLFKVKHVSGTKVVRITGDSMAKFEFPLPPLSEQNRIVGILDTFTESIENLKKQISERKKQYEHYRDQLLDIEGKPGVEMKTLGEVCEVITGGEVPENTIKGQQEPSNSHPFAVYTNGKETYGYTDTYQIDSDAVCISSIGANTGAVFYKKGKFTPAIRLKVLIPYQNVDTKFLYYSAMGIDFKGRNTGSVPNINANYVKSRTIILLPLAEQQRIVTILDTFEASIANLEQQLTHRQKQYEYYRNMLLTFDK